MRKKMALDPDLPQKNEVDSDMPEMTLSTEVNTPASKQKGPTLSLNK